ncbi:5-carboxymethyl-2-hydroxymuconate Delta-isomerase [Uliginosibacterium sp. H1]|uniref:5-carboxymethyl-2-hydroxymuconate Delta-isomerase n=1 Tax=Uliginosibacterium sp. H1 TaxID=3114757 RepID=UPI002E18C285|nr:5-carboxymethyl-2-hydroxymuconate Delta-isomerase [Uliginosibacterium sp. H1]
MPHLVIEYTGNLGAVFDPDAALRAANASLIASGVFEPGHIKSRAVALTHFRVGDCDADQAFIHAELRLHDGRSAETRQALGRGVASALQSVCRTKPGLHVQITVEVLELQRAFYMKAE